MSGIDWSKAPEKPKEEIIKSIISITNYTPEGCLVWSSGVAKKDRSGKVAGHLNP
jgi:hypothetical protein